VDVIALVIGLGWVAFWVYWLAASVGVKIRHPIYSGIILAMIGTAMAVTWYWLVAAVVIAAYFIYSAVTEERYMTERFPDAYPDYKHTTSMLIPFIL
jgi:protein-S-isoprenylcysteine O-methyltransferase Ste14